MFLNIINLLDWLNRKGMHVSTEVDSSANLPEISGIRMIKDFVPKERDSSVALIGSADDFMYSRKAGTIICFKNQIIYVEGEDIESIFNECLHAFEFYNRWETDLLDAVIGDKSLDTFLEIGHRVFQSPMFIAGVNGQTYAITRQYGPEINPVWEIRLKNGNLPISTILSQHESQYFKKMYASHYPLINESPIWGGQILFSSLFVHNQRVGMVNIYEYNYKFSQGDTYLLSIYARILEKVFYLHPEKYSPMSSLENAVVSILERKDDVDWSDVNRLLKNFQWCSFHGYQVLAVAFPSGIDSVISGRLRDLVRNHVQNVCCILYQGKLLVLVNDTDGTILQTVISLLNNAANGNLLFGISLKFADLSMLPSYYQQAIACLDKLRNSKEQVLSAEDIYLELAYDYTRDSQTIKSLIHYDVNRLIEYDRKHNKEYARTLFVFLLCGCNQHETARKLTIHRNTLLYRMNQIKELISSDLNDIHYREILLFSLYLTNASNNIQ